MEWIILPVAISSKSNLVYYCPLYQSAFTACYTVKKTTHDYNEEAHTVPIKDPILSNIKFNKV